MTLHTVLFNGNSHLGLLLSFIVGSYFSACWSRSLHIRVGVFNSRQETEETGEKHGGSTYSWEKGGKRKGDLRPL